MIHLIQWDLLLSRYVFSCIVKLFTKVINIIIFLKKLLFHYTVVTSLCQLYFVNVYTKQKILNDSTQLVFQTGVSKIVMAIFPRGKACLCVRASVHTN